MIVHGNVFIGKNIEKAEVHIHRDKKKPHNKERSDRYRYAEEAEVIKDDVPEPVKKATAQEVGKEDCHEEDYTTHPFANNVTNPKLVQCVMKLLHQKMDQQNSPRLKLRPLFAAIETGHVTPGFNVSELSNEFGYVSSSSFSRYIKKGSAYTAQELDAEIALFSNL